MLSTLLTGNKPKQPHTHFQGNIHSYTWRNVLSFLLIFGQFKLLKLFYFSLKPPRDDNGFWTGYRITRRRSRNPTLKYYHQTVTVMFLFLSVFQQKTIAFKFVFLGIKSCCLSSNWKPYNIKYYSNYVKFRKECPCFSNYYWWCSFACSPVPQGVASLLGWIFNRDMHFQFRYMAINFVSKFSTEMQILCSATHAYRLLGRCCWLLDPQHVPVASFHNWFDIQSRDWSYTKRGWKRKMRQ